MPNPETPMPQESDGKRALRALGMVAGFGLVTLGLIETFDNPELMVAGVTGGVVIAAASAGKENLVRLGAFLEGQAYDGTEADDSQPGRQQG